MTNEVDFLQTPAWADAIVSVEDHLDEAAGLSRAMWLLLSGGEVDTRDVRDVRALKTLASAIADHTSAAELAYSRQDQNSRKIRVKSDT